jgi:hypothetical protein
MMVTDDRKGPDEESGCENATLVSEYSPEASTIVSAPDLAASPRVAYGWAMEPSPESDDVLGSTKHTSDKGGMLSVRSRSCSFSTAWAGENNKTRKLPNINNLFISNRYRLFPKCKITQKS